MRMASPWPTIDKLDGHICAGLRGGALVSSTATLASDWDSARVEPCCGESAGDRNWIDGA